MKTMLLTIVTAAGLLAWMPWHTVPKPAPAVAVAATLVDDDPLLAGREWTQLLKYDLPDAMVRRPVNQGAMGCSVICFRVDNRTQGSALICTLDRPAVAMFIGWGFPDEFVNTAPLDLRAIFTELDGTRHVSKFAGGGGHGLLFQSPDLLPIAQLARVELYRPADADWVLHD